MSIQYRYYIQNHPKGVRRYSDSGAQRWDTSVGEWATHCASEEACHLTKDKRVTENEALRLIETL